GSSSPNTAGAHAAHNALPGLQGNCAACHLDASHNGWVDLKFPAAYNAKSGTAVDNGDGTCSNISCHGGGKTPDWWTGEIDVNRQCVSCHSAGTGQYNGYWSGRHAKHVVDKKVACTSCHNTTGLAASHFIGLDTAALDSAAATIGGASTQVSSFNAGTRSCATSCHGSKSW
ncbi:MAG: CxxxxCH/CxxCH domain-containing protein, partial [Desulfuromonadales bacterium]|nr:CxxxxCH/CxxCH domain-containing protein [Desulfuromonadales bacterium]